MRPGSPSSANEPESLLARWSRRKRQIAQPGEEVADADDSSPSGELRGPATSPSGEDAPQPQPGDADMPPLESLGPESDYSGFMSPGVSEELRRLALRKLFHSPLFNVTDGLDDYDDDFTSFAVLHEAFHAKRAQRSAPESAPPESPDYDRADDPDHARSTGRRSSEAEHQADIDSEPRPGGEPAGEEEEAIPRPPGEALESHTQASDGRSGASVSEVASLEPGSDDSGASVGAEDSRVSRLSASPVSRESEAVSGAVPAPPAGNCVDEETQVESACIPGDACADDAPASDTGDGPRHG